MAEGDKAEPKRVPVKYALYAGAALTAGAVGWTLWSRAQRKAVEAPPSEAEDPRLFQRFS